MKERERLGLRLVKPFDIVNEVSPSIKELFLIVTKDYSANRIILNCQFLPSEVLSFILDTESLIGIMGNEHISFKSQTPVSGLAGLEPRNG